MSYILFLGTTYSCWSFFSGILWFLYYGLTLVGIYLWDSYKVWILMYPSKKYLQLLLPDLWETITLDHFNFSSVQWNQIRTDCGHGFAGDTSTFSPEPIHLSFILWLDCFFSNSPFYWEDSLVRFLGHLIPVTCLGWVQGFVLCL